MRINPRAALATAAVVVGVLGWLVFAVSDDGADRVAGAVLLACAVLAAVAAVPAGYRALRLLGSGALVLGGVVAAVLGAGTGAGDLLLIGGVPVAAGILAGAASLRG